MQTAPRISAVGGRDPAGGLGSPPGDGVSGEYGNSVFAAERTACVKAGKREQV